VPGQPAAVTGDHYKWMALSNTTAAVFMSALDRSIVIIALPAIFRGVASGMRSIYQNSGTALSIGVFFSLMIAGLASTLPRAPAVVRHEMTIDSQRISVADLASG
jgi:hypothetical protein